MQIEILNICGRGFEYYLKLVMLEETVGIFAVAAVGGAAAWLDVNYFVRFGAQDAQECFRVHGAGTYFNVIWLLKYAAFVGPEFFQLEN